MTGRLQMLVLTSPVGIAAALGGTCFLIRQNDFLGHVTWSCWSRLDAFLPPERELQTIPTHPGDN
jgi:hypothetical protein